MRVLYTFVAATAAVLALAGPATATTGTASAGSLTVTITLNDVTFTGPDCIEAPVVQVNYSGTGSVEIAASKPGSSTSIETFSYSDQAGTVNDSFLICPFLHGAGTYVIRGLVAGDEVSAPLPQGLSFVVSTAPAKFSQLQARQSGKTLKIKGRATALSDRGDIGAQGEVTLQGRLSKGAGGKGKWVTVGTALPNDLGIFSFSGSTQQRLKGAEIRAVLATSEWSGEATASTRVK